MKREEFQKMIAEQFSNLLEEKGLNWTKGWNAPELASPYNGISKYKYRGVNIFSLFITSLARGYDDPRWYTMNQIMDRQEKYHKGDRWHLKKGTRASYVEYWYPYDKTNKCKLTWEEYSQYLKDGRDPEEMVLCTKYTPVFNACEIEGLPPLEAGRKLTIFSPDTLIDLLKKGMDVPIHDDGGNQSYYRPATDSIHLPKPEYFHSKSAYEATALHELAHATGHESRLKRDLINRFGSEDYAYEELVAEITSAMMGGNLTEQPEREDIDNHKAYIQNWLRAIKDKEKYLIDAIKDAQKATAYMELKAGIIDEAEFKAVSK